jgi:hypothetical protein
MQRREARPRGRRESLALAALLATLAVALWATALVAPPAPIRGAAHLPAAQAHRPERPPRAASRAAPPRSAGGNAAAAPLGRAAPTAPAPPTPPAAAASAHCAAADCDDRNPCTENACDPATGACMSRPVPDGRACPGDGDGCTVDVCVAGRCVHRREPRSAPCADDGAPCTADQCAAGRCTPRPTCVDLDACHTATCDAATGDCVQVRRSCDDGDPCTAGACDPATGVCAWVDLPDCGDDGAAPWDAPYA